MSEFNVGDLVEARKGERVIRDRVRDHFGSQFLGGPATLYGQRMTTLANDGYSLSLVEAATPPLPTEPGHFLTCESNIFSYDGLYWSCGEEELTPEEVAEEAPLTRLEPVPVTAKKVLERFANFWEFGPPANILIEMGEIAKEFGVSDA